MIGRIDVLEELKKRKEKKQENLLEEVKQWIFEETYSERRIFEKDASFENIDTSLFPRHCIYDLNQIKDISIKYKLRFLDQTFFKEEIPYEGIIKIKEISRQQNIELKKFKILAPAERFALKDPNADPILFAQLNQSEFLFIHKWGNDMAWYKKLSAFPFRNLKTLLFSMLLFSLFCASIFPTSWFGIENLSYFNFFRGFLFFWTFVVTASITSYCWFLLGKDFSSMVWDSKYF